MKEIDNELFSVFMEEIREQLESAFELMAALEDSPRNLDTLNALFRVLHTVKGSAGMIGASDMATLAHSLEDVFDKMRSSPATVEKGVLNLLKEGLNALSTLTAGMRSGSDAEAGISLLGTRLQEALSSMGSPAAVEDPLVAVDSSRTPPESAERYEDGLQGTDEDVSTGYNHLFSASPFGGAPQSAQSKTVVRATSMAPVSKTIRVGVEKLDLVVNLMRELAISRIRFEQRFDDLLAIHKEAVRTASEWTSMKTFCKSESQVVSIEKGLRKRLRDFSAASNASVDFDGISKEVDEFLKAHRNSDAWKTMSACQESRAWFDEHFSRVCCLMDEQMLLLEESSDSVRSLMSDLQEGLLKLRMVPVQQVFRTFPRFVRDLSEQKQKKIALEIEGGGTELDKSIVDEVGGPLMHALRNCIDHGIEESSLRMASGKDETGRISLRASYKGNNVVIEISDDGAGISPDKCRVNAVQKGLLGSSEAMALSDREACNLIFRPGFSTADEVSETSGRGVGMDAVVQDISRLNGTVDFTTVPGEGTTFRFIFPITLAIIQVLLVRSGTDTYALPLDAVDEVITVMQDEIMQMGVSMVIRHREQIIPLISLEDMLSGELSDDIDSEQIPLVILDNGQTRAALSVCQIIGKQEVVVKSLGDMIKRTPHFMGATILGDGKVILILDGSAAFNTHLDGGGVKTDEEKGTRGSKDRIVKVDTPDLSSGSSRSDPSALTSESGAAGRTGVSGPGSQGRILVVEDSASVRKTMKKILTRAGYEVFEAIDGRDGLEKVEAGDFDLITVDILMPRMDGYQFTEAVRKLQKHQKTPIVMVSSKSHKLDRAMGFNAGADEYITKPFEDATLTRTVMRLIG